MNIALEAILAKLPIEEKKQTIHKHIGALEKQLPDKRLERGIDDMILGFWEGNHHWLRKWHDKTAKRMGKVGQRPNGSIGYWKTSV